MAIRWDFNEPGGTVTFENGDVYPWYEGNALMICNRENFDDEGIRTGYSLNFFFANKEHAKNCLGLSKGYDSCFIDGWGIIELVINRKYVNQWKVLVDLMCKAFPDIKIILQ